MLSPQFKAISECGHMKFSQPVNQSKHGRKSYPEPVGQTLDLRKQKTVVKSSYVLVTKKKGKSKVLSRWILLI